MTIGDYRLRESFNEFSNSKENTEIKLSGILGISESRVQIPYREGFVYVRLRDNLNEIIAAYNGVVSPVYNLPVLIKWDVTRYVVVGRDLERYVGWGTTSSYLPLHGASHSFNESGAGDVVWVYSRQFMPWLVTPSGSSASGNALVQEGYPYFFESQWKYLSTTGTPSLVDTLPTGGNRALMSLVYLDQKENIVKVTAGTDEFDSGITGTAEVIPYIPPISEIWHIPLAGVRTTTGTSIIGWNNLYDLRPIFTTPPTGTGGGGGGDVSFEGFKDGSVIFVEDEQAQEDNASFFYDDDGDALILGNTGSANVVAANTLLSLQGNGGGVGQEILVAGNAAAFPYTYYLKTNGTFESPTTIIDDDLLSRIDNFGYDGSDYVDKARIDVRATEDWSVNARGTKYQIRTTPTGTAGTQAVGEWRGHGLDLLKGFQTGQFVTTDTDYAMDGEDCILLIDSETEDNVGVILPPATNQGQIVYLKMGGNIGGQVYYSGYESDDTIDGSLSGTLLTNYRYVILITDGDSSWYKFSDG